MSIKGRPTGLGGQHFRRMVAMGSADGDSYNKSDSGCADATLYLGRSSLCLECPFLENEAPCWIGKKRGPKVGGKRNGG